MSQTLQRTASVGSPWSVYHIKDARPYPREILGNWLGFLLVHSGEETKTGNSGAVYSKSGAQS